jgi:hypothetical protein
MTTPWQELTLPGGWAKAQTPPPIASGVNALSATFSVSLPTSNPRLTITQYGGPLQIEIAAFYSEREMTAGVREYRLPQTWFRGPFLERWAYATQVHYHPALREVIRAYATRSVLAIRRSPYRDDQNPPSWYRSLLLQWKYRLLVRFHPALRAVIKRYAARIVVPPSHRPW